MEVILNKVGPVDDNAFSAIEAQIVNIAGPILKTEWKRVRKGEPIFWIAKWAALVVLAAGAAVAVLWYFC